MYRRPTSTPRQLRTRPRLESWNARAAPAQQQLGAYLDEVVRIVALPQDADHLAKGLCSGLPTSRSLTAGGGDLDNYLRPVVRRLGANRIDAAFCSKVHARESTIVVEQAARSAPSRPADMAVRTSISATDKEWKRQIQQACASLVTKEPGEGALGVDLEFVVSSRRN